jgi:hypothetical protein
VSLSVRAQRELTCSLGFRRTGKSFCSGERSSAGRDEVARRGERDLGHLSTKHDVGSRKGQKTD